MTLDSDVKENLPRISTAPPQNFDLSKKNPVLDTWDVLYLRGSAAARQRDAALVFIYMKARGLSLDLNAQRPR